MDMLLFPLKIPALTVDCYFFCMQQHVETHFVWEGRRAFCLCTVAASITVWVWWFKIAIKELCIPKPAHCVFKRGSCQVGKLPSLIFLWYFHCQIMMLHDVQYHSLSQDEDVRSVAYCLRVVVVASTFAIVVVVVASTFAIHAPSAWFWLGLILACGLSMQVLWGRIDDIYFRE